VPQREARYNDDGLGSPPVMHDDLLCHNDGWTLGCAWFYWFESEPVWG
jgi:hypothetical protein